MMRSASRSGTSTSVCVWPTRMRADLLRRQMGLAGDRADQIAWSQARVSTRADKQDRHRTGWFLRRHRRRRSLRRRVSVGVNHRHRGRGDIEQLELMRE